MGTVALRTAPEVGAPHDLAEHECLNGRPAADAPPYRWEFSEDGHDFAVSVPTRMLSTDPNLNVRLARAGADMTMVYAYQERGDLAGGALVEVPWAFSTPFLGYALKGTSDVHRTPRHAAPRALPPPSNRNGPRSIVGAVSI